MIYISSAQAAKKWGISERSVRNYCAGGRVGGAFLKGKTWNIPESAEKPARGNIGISEQPARVDDIIETTNHFRCVDMIISNADKKLSQSFIKELHRTLKSGTSDSRRSWFAVGEYKRFPNEVGGEDTISPKDTEKELRNLILWYEELEAVSLEDILDFHARFEKIHPFQDGNGRVGRLIMFKECLRNNIVPFIIDESIKIPYYNGLKNWGSERGYLIGTCGLAQDAFKSLLDYFKIKY